EPCWLNGTITDALTTFPVSGAIVSVVGLTVDDVSAFDGGYATGYITGGVYTVTVSAPGYLTATIDNVQLVNGQVTIQDVALTPLVSFGLQGSVTTAGTGVPVPNAMVEIVSNTYNYSVQADANGNWQLPSMFADVFTITAGQWGWHTYCAAGQALAPGSGPINIELQQGYYDDMVLDFQWTNDATASTGAWARGIPLGTANNGTASNPGLDVVGDCGEIAYVTGNGGGAAGTDDVDDGRVRLHSPTFDATVDVEPHVRYARWFYNGGGTGTPNDQLVISLSNGTDTMAIETVVYNTPGAHTWVAKDIRVLDFIAPTTTMKLHATTADNVPGHIVEAGLDAFELYYANTAHVDEASNIDFQLWPNPGTGAFTITTVEVFATRVEVIDATGRVVFAQGLVAGQR
ncbi:MAG TPA: carboxypeptidase-like regulatory domain-containing protein, partial [Flavobacteriales bacterium]|nr:carboxypeptidase-like regulatory domain-containing protein [Flavobacteriales bacterium]